MRGFLTVVIIAGALLIAMAIALRSDNRKPQEQAQPPVAQEVAETETPQPEPEPEAEVAPEPAAPSTAQPVESMTGLRAEPFAEARVATIGSINPDSGYKVEVDISAWGAGLLQIHLTDYMKSVDAEEHYTVLDAPAVPGGKARIYPFAARTVWINGSPISLVDKRWELLSPADYRTTLKRESDAPASIHPRAVYALKIVNNDGAPVAELRRTWSVQPDSYHIACDQQVVNLTDAPLEVIWEQRVQGDAPLDAARYMGDRRQMLAAYYRTVYDPKRVTVYDDDAWHNRQDLLPEFTPDNLYDPPTLVPPDAKDPRTIVWLASINRYFALVTHPPVISEEGRPDPLEKTFPHVQMEVLGRPTNEPIDPRVAMFVLRTDTLRIAPGETRNIDLGLYAGPRDKDIFREASNERLGLGKLIRYELGCIWCTFQWLAKFLLGFLDVLHTIVRDWAVAIIILVLCVRTCLHPITKKAQVNMMMMGKQMQSLQPELEKLRKRYADDQQKLNTETMKLYREKGVNPAGMLGCAPMFLQMPIWVALYAMLFYAIELRHQPAFYGFFQMFGDWQFLADLAKPDAFITFSHEPVRLGLPLINQLDFATLNILPIVWTVVMFFQQKYMTPPPANEQAAQQQKMMRFMMLLFPLFLYSAPSGLTLYILASSVAGIVDSYYVRKHVKQQEESGDLTKPKKPRKPGGFMDRLAKAMEEKQRDLAEKQKQSGGGNKNPGKNRKR